MTSSTTFSFFCYVLYMVCSVTAFSGPRPRVRLTLHNSQADGNNEHRHLERRQVLSQTANLILLPSVIASSPQVSKAAAPITLKDTDSLAAIAKRKFRAKPPKILRRKLSIDFAVLLMRSSYNSLDSLDCVAMASADAKLRRNELIVIGIFLICLLFSVCRINFKETL